MDESLLRRRLLAAIGSGGFLVASLQACEGGEGLGEVQVDEPARVYTDGGQAIRVPASSCERSDAVQCYLPDELPRLNQGNVLPVPDAEPPPPPPVAPRDGNRCVPQDFVEDGCCNKAVAGPIFDGNACCYRFCKGVCCGRPLIVEGSARIANTLSRDDWASACPSQEQTALDAFTRVAITNAWVSDARMEHASIASFARFTLDLLAFGAPPELVEASQRASIDEIRHARLCFGIASEVGGEPIGPGPLNVGGAAVSASLAEAAAAAVREGCIGETLAALFAGRALESASEPMVRAALREIARDESRHAELAWRFVRWACDQDADVRSAVERSFADGLAAITLPAEAPLGTNEESWLAFGRLGSGEASAVAVSAVREVLEPCLVALLGKRSCAEMVTRRVLRA